LLREKWPDIGHKNLASGVDIDEPIPAAAQGYKAGWTVPDGAPLERMRIVSNK
jgi:hypothetical protein